MQLLVPGRCREALQVIDIGHCLVINPVELLCTLPRINVCPPVEADATIRWSYCYFKLLSADDHIVVIRWYSIHNSQGKS